MNILSENEDRNADEHFRILFVGPGTNGRFSSYFYSTDKKLRNGFIRNGCNVIDFSDRDEASKYFSIRFFGAHLANKKLKQSVAENCPDIIVLFHADIISDNTLKEIKRENHNVLMINIYNDLIFDSERYQKVLCRGKICHQTFLNSAGPELLALRSDGININYFPNPADSSVENINSYLSREKDYDLFFAASGKRDSKRFALIDKISELDQSLRVGVFGSNRNRILGDNYFQIIKRSEAALNWSKSNDIRYCSSNRMAQLFGAGVAVCQPKASRFQDFLSDDAAIWFDGAEDLQKN